MTNPPPAASALGTMHGRTGFSDGAPLNQAALDAVGTNVVNRDSAGNTEQLASVRVGAAGWVTTDAGGNLWLTTNAYFDRPSGNWYPADVTQPATAMVLSTGAVTFYSALATSGALAWTSGLALPNAGFPAATNTVRGGIKAGTGVSIDGNAALSVSYGTGGGTAAQGNDTRITGALQSSQAGVAGGVATLDGGAHLAASQHPALTGDVTASAGSTATALKNTGTAGTYAKVTTDAQGRVTAGTGLAAADLPIATSAALGAVKVDGTILTADGAGLLTINFGGIATPVITTQGLAGASLALTGGSQWKVNGDGLSEAALTDNVGFATEWQVADGTRHIAKADIYALAVGADATVAGSMSVDGPITGATLELSSGFTLRDNGDGEVGYALTDDAGFGILWAGPSGVGFAGSVTSNGYSDAEIAARNGQSLAASVPGPLTPELYCLPQPFVAPADVNLIIGGGQSDMTGQEGFPALSTTARNGWMVGNSEHAGGNSASDPSVTWTPQGGTATFNPLIATVLEQHTGSALLNPTQQAALSPTDGAVGESPLVACVNGFADRVALHAGVAAVAQKYVGMNVAIGGRSIADWQKTATPNYYQRYLDAAAVCKAAATAAGKSFKLAAFLWDLGETDYVNGTMTRSQYATYLKQLMADLHADVTVGIAGQTDAAPWYLVQPGGQVTNDNMDLAIGMAIQDVAATVPNVFLVGSYYPYPNKDDHLTSNSFRQLGCMIEKVMYRTLVLRETWKPVLVRKATRLGADILIDFIVPRPPLTLGTAYDKYAPRNFADLGFTVTADGNPANRLGIAAAAIVSDTQVHLQLASPPTAEPFVAYADETYHNGKGNLRDSDDAVAFDTYSYTPGSGQDAGEDIPGFVGSRYSLANWAVPFCIQTIPG